jgi:N-acetylmuramoyl-L-alanine amidase
MPFEPESRTVAEVAPSPNHNERPVGQTPDILLLHYTGMPTAAAALERLRNPDAAVSCPYFIHEDGRIVQMVPEARRAWHAGLSSWEGSPDVNARAVGVEIVNPGHDGGLPPYPAPQIAAVIGLSRDVIRRRNIRPDRVLGHSDVAPDRKEDPGELFPWDALHRAGVGHWVEPAPIRDGKHCSVGDTGAAVDELQAQLAMYGYGVPVGGIFDEATAAVVRAFQRHFRPARVDGIADRSTLETLANLIAARSIKAG